VEGGRGEGGRGVNKEEGKGLRAGGPCPFFCQVRFIPIHSLRGGKIREIK